MDKRRSNQSSPVEIFKDFLIVLLLCSAVFLLWEAQLLVGLPNQLAPPMTETGNSEYVLQASAARPYRIATISGEGGALYGVQYHDEDVDQLFQLASNLLRETLGSLSAPASISEQSWQKLLNTAPGLYLDVAGDIPLSILAGWLSSTEEPALTDVPQRMLLTVWQGDVALCYQIAGNQFYRATTQVVDPSRLAALVAQNMPNGAYFAFQSDDLTGIDPYTLISAVTPTPAVYSVVNPITTEESRALLLSQLGLDDQSGSTYTSSDGLGIVVRHDSDTLRITGSGIVTYEGESGFSRYPIPSPNASPTTFDIVERCRSLASDALSPFTGTARLQLLSVDEVDGQHTVTFGLLLNGSPIQYTDGGEVAQFVVQNGYITHFTLRIRSYSPTQSFTTLLPETQAAAAMRATGNADDDLVLCYTDNGSATTTASWVARQEG